MIATDQHIVNVNTANKNLFKSGSSGDFIYDLNMQQSEQYEYVSVIQAEIPKSFYNVDDPYNFFYLIEDGNQITISLTEGNYDEFTFVDELSTQLTNLSTNNIVYTVELLESLNKWKITATQNGGIPPITISINPYNYLYRNLGFFKNNIETFDLNGILISPRVVELSPNPNIFLRTDMPLTNINDNNLLQVIPTTQVLPFSYITFRNIDLIDTARKCNLTKNTQHTYRFYFTTDDEDQGTNNQFRNIDFNGVEVSFTLLFFNKINIVDYIKDTNKILLTNKKI